MPHPTGRRHAVALMFILCVELLVAGWWRWPWTIAPIQTAFDYGTGHAVVISEHWRRSGALREHFLPAMSIDRELPEWPYRSLFSQEYSSVPPLAFILHYTATRALPSVEPVLLGKLLAQALTAVSVLIAAWLLYGVFGFWPTLVGLSFLISGVPCILWFANGYFAVNVSLATQLVLTAWCAAIAFASISDRDGDRVPPPARGFVVGAALAFAGAFADYVPVFANSIACAALLALAALRGRGRRAGRRALIASAAGVASGTAAAGGATVVLYSLQMGLSRYREAITERVAIRTGGASLVEHVDVIRRQMLLAWPAGLLVALTLMLLAVAAWCAIAVAKKRGGDAADVAVAMVIALALGFGPTLIFQYRAVNYVSIHYWFSGTWVVGWTVTVCAFMAVLERVTGAFRRWFPALAAAVLAVVVGENVSFAAAQSTTDRRTGFVRLYQALGRDLPADGAPIVVADLTIQTPGLFEDFPYATAYLRRAVLLRENDGGLRLPAGDEMYDGRRLRFGGEDARDLLRRRGGDVYVVYDADARTCRAADVPLPTAGRQFVTVRVCRMPAADLVDRPDAVLGPMNAGYACTAPPPPSDLHVVSNARGVVQIAWTPSPGRALQVVEAGSAPGRADILVQDVGWATTFMTPANPGTYHARVRGKNMCGIGAASNELTVVVE